MEFVALSGLIALGVAVSQLATGTTTATKKEGFHSLGLGLLPQSEPPTIPAPSDYYTIGIQKYLTEKESINLNDINNRLNALGSTGSPDAIHAMKTQVRTILQRGAERAAAARGTESARASSNTAFAGTELDMMYKTPAGQTYPSEPNAGPEYGTPVQYATSMPPLRGIRQGQGQGPMGQGPMPEPIESSIPQVAFVSNGVEKSSTWVNGSGHQRMVSALSGQEIDPADFKHNNMQPFFGGSVKQNMTASGNTSKLDMFTGAGSTDIQKQEISPMFNTAIPFGQPFGNEANADFIRSRIVEPGRRNNEKAFEPTRVGAAVGEKGGITGKGGFQQLEVNEIMKRAMPTTDKLRTLDNPKVSYNNQVVPGVHFVTSAALDSGEVRKYRPDTFFLNETGERNGIATGEVVKGANRPTQVLKYTTRTDTTEELIGAPASQEAFKSYVAGDYKTPMGQQFGGAGYRNGDGSSYGLGPRDDYGASSYEVRPNERMATQDRVMGLNLSPADTGAVPVHYNDDARPTRRGDTVGNIRQSGTATGYAAGAPATTSWDPSDVARTTVRELTSAWDYLGISGPGAGPERLKVYDPNDIAKPTQKSQLTQDSRMAGPAISVNKEFTSREDVSNMRKNESKTAIAKGRKPIAGNGGLAVFKGEIHQKSNRLTADDVNDRALAVNRAMEMTPGSADLGRVQYRNPLKLNVSTERNQPFMVSEVENNPLQQSLYRNAVRDSAVLEQMEAQRRSR